MPGEHIPSSAAPRQIPQESPMPQEARDRSNVAAFERMLGVEAEIELLLRNSEVANTGSHAIILKVEKKRLSPELSGALSRLGINLKEQTAVKALKVFRPGAGNKEYAMLSKAYAVLEKQPRLTDYALVPGPIFLTTLELGNETRDYLNEYGATLQNRAEIIAMDFIETEDLATALYKQTLKYWFKDEYEHVLAGLQTFEQLQRKVATLLRFEEPKRYAEQSGESRFAHVKVFTRNTDKLFRFLRTHGFVLNPCVLEKVRNTIKLLHSQKLFHNDLHARNIMVGSGIDSEDPDVPVHLIDFEYGSESRLDAEKGFIDDMACIKELEPLTVSREPERRAQEEARRAAFQALRNRLDKSKKWGARYEEMKKRITEDGSDPEALLKRGLAHAASLSESELDQYLALLLRLAENRVIPTDMPRELVHYERQSAQSLLSAFAKSRLTWFERLLNGKKEAEDAP
ncbi:MAG: hypothetical protein Q8R13_00585 [bacterium]|nr:hypothetical protein [bacterium]